MKRVRWDLVAAVAFLLWTVANLGLAIAWTGSLEQDSIYYAEVAERLAAGEGATSLSDRRGPTSARDWPQPFEATTCWPYMLAMPVWMTGLPAPLLGQLFNLGALVATFLVMVVVVRRAEPDAPRWCGVVVCALGVSSQWGVRAAVVNESDAWSLLLTAVWLLAALRFRRPQRASLVEWTGLFLATTLAIAARQQNVALLVPLVWLLLPPSALRWGVMVVGVAAGLALSWPECLDGLAWFANPDKRGSFVRSVRWLAPAAVVGLVLARGRLVVQLGFWLAVGHLLILLRCPDPNTEPRWMFGIRHGLPFHLFAVAAAHAAIACGVAFSRRAGGWRRGVVVVLIAATLLGAAADNLPRPNRLLRRWPDRTNCDLLAEVEEYLQRHPLPDESVVASWASDLVAYRWHRRSLHLRGFDDGPASLKSLRDRATHVLFVFSDSHLDVVRRFVAGQRKIHDAIAPDAIRLFERESGGGQVVLLQIKG